MPFYKDNQKAILYKDNYEPASVVGPGGSYAVKYENILNPVAIGYGSANQRFEALGDGSFKVTRVNGTTSTWEYCMQFTKNYTIIEGHKYYFQIDCYVSRLPSSITTLSSEHYYNGTWISANLPTVVNEWQTLHKFSTRGSIDVSQLRTRILVWLAMSDSQGFEDGDYYMVRRPIFIDLTDAFGSGYEPETQQELYAALPQLANGGYMPPTKATTLEHTYIPTKVPTAYWIGENCNVHWNQIVPDGTFTQTAGTIWKASPRCTITIANNELVGTYAVTGQYDYFVQANYLGMINSGHKYYITYDGKVTTAATNPIVTVFTIGDFTNSFGGNILTSDYTHISKIYTPISTSYGYFICIGFLGTITQYTLGDSFSIKNFNIVDLTEMFGAGNEPTITEFETMYPSKYEQCEFQVTSSVGNRITAYKGNNYVNFRQLFDITKYGSNSTLNGITYTRGSGNSPSVTLNGTVTDAVSYWLLQNSNTPIIKAGHKYYFTSFLGSYRLYLRWWDVEGHTCEHSSSAIWTAQYDQSNSSIYLRVGPIGQVYDNVKIYPMLFDLTEMFGAGHEPTKEQFDLLFPNTYYPYTASTYIRDVKGYDTQLTIPNTKKDLYRVNFNQIMRSGQGGESTKCGITVTRTVTDQYVTITATGTATAWSGDPNWYINSYNNLIAGHKYYVRANGGNLVSMYMYTGWTTHPCVNALGTIVTASDTGRVNESVTVRFAEYAPEGTVVNETFAIEIIDLTQTFGAGKEPDNVYILNELFGHTFLPYTTSMWVDSPNNIITETPSQITKMLAGYRTVQKQGYEISVDGTYNDPFVCTYYPEQSTQLTSTGANKVDLVNHAGEVGLEVLPDGRFKWTQSPTSSGRFLGFFTNPDGSYVSLTAGQTLTTSCIVDDIVLSGEVNYICGLIYYNNDGTYSYIGAISSDTSLIGQWQSHSYTTQKAVDKIRLYFTNASGTQPTDYVIFKDFQLEIDTNVGQYEPYTSQLPAPTPTNMLPISYNKSQKIVLDTDATHSTYNFPITSDAKLIWKPSDYSTDFRVNVFNEGVRMKKRVGTDYAQIVPLVTKSSAATDTAFGITTNSVISLEANKTYCLVFRYKKVNSTCVGLQKGTSTEWACNIQHTDGTITECLEVPCLTHDPSAVINKDFCYDEGWSWARYTPPTAGNYKVRIGADTPNMHKVIEDRGSYIQFTDIALYEGELTRSNQSITNLQAVLSDGNKQTIVSNKELGYVTRAGYAFQPNTLQPYVNYNNEWKSCLTQNTYTITYKGDESWYARPNTSHSFQCNAHGFNVNGGFCTHFVPFDTSSQIDVQDGVYLSYSYAVIITNMSCNSLDEFKAFLAAEYNKGTPVTIVCGREYGVSDFKTYNNPLLAHTLPYHTDINTDAEYLTVSVKESI